MPGLRGQASGGGVMAAVMVSRLSAPLSRGKLHLVVGVDEIVAGLGLVAVEAAVQIGVRVSRLVGTEDLILPFAVALRLGVFAAPSGLLLHHCIALDRVRLDEAAAGVLGRIALPVELGGILDHRDHCSGWKRRPLLGSIDRDLTGVIFTNLLVFRPVESHVNRAFGIFRRE